MTCTVSGETNWREADEIRIIDGEPTGLVVSESAMRPLKV